MTTGPLDLPPAEFLPPGSVRFRSQPSGGIEVEIDGDRFPSVTLRQVFPLTPTERMVVLIDSEERYLGTVSDFRALDPESAEHVEEELRQQYFMPTILRVTALRKRFGLVRLTAVTSSGNREIWFRSARDDIRELGPGRFLLTDVTGNRFELPCLDVLDEASQKFWKNLV